MPANLSPEYKAAQAALRQARDPSERLQLSARNAAGDSQTQGNRSSSGRHQAAHPRTRQRSSSDPRRAERAAALRWWSGRKAPLRSHCSARRTPASRRCTHDSRARTRTLQRIPFTTQFPEPGMMPYQDVHFQLVDLPAVSPEHPTPWLASALQTADACLLVVDLGDPDCVGEIETVHDMMRERGVTLAEHWEGTRRWSEDAADRGSVRAVSAHVAARKQGRCSCRRRIGVAHASRSRGPSLSCAGGLRNQRSGAW